MMTRHYLLVLATTLISAEVLADNIAGVDRFLCSTLRATVCVADGNCATVAPADLNIPQFIEVDTKAKSLATTAASGENRRTTAALISRAEERLVMQGYENGRAFSMLVREETGQASFASVADDRSVIVFAACTPAPGR
jgi:hypothetical protein